MINATAKRIIPLTNPPNGTVRVPGSKSITNRALILSALHARDKPCVLRNALQCEDTAVMIDGLGSLGVAVEADWNQAEPTIRVASHHPPNATCAADIFTANSGTTMRFLTALASLRTGRVRLDGSPRMRQRPVGDLLDALIQLGVDAKSEAQDNCPPVVINSKGWKSGHVTMRGDISSQYLTGVLMAATAAPVDVHITIDGPLVSQPYIDMTLRMLDQWGLRAEPSNSNVFHVPGKQQSQLREYVIEPDASAASYFFAAAAITGGKVGVAHLNENSLQGDVRFVDVLEQMGCHIHKKREIVVEGRASRGVDVDMNDISDTVMTLAAVACFAESPTTIRNVAHIRHKETDRLAAMANELRKIGADVEERGDGLVIRPGQLHGAEIDTYNDHRIAMSMALIGLQVPGIVIRDPECVGKTYPGFFKDFEGLGA